MREPRRGDHISDRVDVWFSRPHVIVDFDVTFLQLNMCVLEPEPVGVSSTPDCHLEFFRPEFAIRVIDLCNHSHRAVFDERARHDRQR